MKLSTKRFTIQIISVVLTVTGFLINFQITTLILMGATLFAGAFFCGWVCPYGTLQDLFSRMGKMLGIKKKKMPKAIQKYMQYVRYIIFALVVLSSSDLIFTIMGYDPRANFSGLIGGTAISVAALMVLLSIAATGMVFERPFCNYLCYEGAKHGLLSLARPVTIQRDAASCVDCGQCDRVCPMNIEVSKCSQVRSAQCINCFECTQACPVKNTLTYGQTPLNRRTKFRYVLAAAILVVGGIGYILYNGLNSSEASTDSDEASIMDEASVLEEAMTEEALALLGEAKGIDDGVYTGSGIGFRGTITVEVTVGSQMVTDIAVVKNSDDTKWFNRAVRLIDDIIDEQSTAVSAVSGATYSSNGIIDAVANALEEARQSL